MAANQPPGYPSSASWAPQFAQNSPKGARIADPQRGQPVSIRTPSLGQKFSPTVAGVARRQHGQTWYEAAGSSWPDDAPLTGPSEWSWRGGMPHVHRTLVIGRL